MKKLSLLAPHNSPGEPPVASREGGSSRRESAGRKRAMGGEMGGEMGWAMAGLMWGEMGELMEGGIG